MGGGETREAVSVLGERGKGFLLVVVVVVVVEESSGSVGTLGGEGGDSAVTINRVCQLLHTIKPT